MALEKIQVLPSFAKIPQKTFEYSLFQKFSNWWIQSKLSRNHNVSFLNT